MTLLPLDHGGDLDAAMLQYGGKEEDWLDLSTGINPEHYAINAILDKDWSNLPSKSGNASVCSAARKFWNVPDSADILAIPGCSSAIMQIPTLMTPGSVEIKAPTYNEHAAAFQFHGWKIQKQYERPKARVVVNPNNPTGEFSTPTHPVRLNVIDESFCDTSPQNSHIACAARPGNIVLKSFGKFWGLAGLRLGFAIGDPTLIESLRQRLGPWPVSGTALSIGTQALKDFSWAEQTRIRLNRDIARLDHLLVKLKAKPIGNCSLFRTYVLNDAPKIQNHLAKSFIWSRVFPYSGNWIRLGLPPEADWDRLEKAL